MSPLSLDSVNQSQQYLLSVPQKSVFKIKVIAASRLDESGPACNWLLLGALGVTLGGGVISLDEQQTPQSPLSWVGPSPTRPGSGMGGV